MAARTKKKPARKKTPAKKAAKKTRAKKKTTQRVKGRPKKTKAKPKAKATSRAKARAKPKSGRKPTRRPVKKPAGKKSRTTARKAAKGKLSKAQLKTQRDRERAAKQREKERERKEKEKVRLQKQREKERVSAEKEKLRLKKQREKERVSAAKEREREKERKRKEKDAERKARDAERERLRKERDADRLRKEAERERLREAARRAKEEERAKREAEREAYRQAKEAEREKLRKDREAAKRALEGRVAQATKRAQRVAGVGGRGATTRVYRPDAIPNQSGTRRQASDDEQGGHEQARVIVEAPAAPAPPPPPAPAPVVLERLDERYSVVRERLEKTPQSFRREYAESLDMSWIYHDSALEGVVYTYQELKTAIDPNITVVPDSSLQPVCEEIRRHKTALDMARDLGEKKRATINVDLIKKLYLVLHPDDGDLKSVKYRKDIPQHRLYFHEYAAPDKIAYRVRQVADWINGPEPKKIKDPVRIAARAHYDLLRVFPFAQDSGKVARLLMNILLLRAGYPPAIIHSTERQRYYDALKGSLPTIISMVREAMNNGTASIEKRLDDQNNTARGFTTQ